jgi:DNA (cytosine-5)-methyltransferase 1
VEKDKYAAATYKANHADCQLIEDDIRSIKRFDIEKRNQPLIVFGGPPCQGFSTSNQRTRSSQNENNWLFQEFVRIVRTIKPEWVVFENVKGILETEKGKFLEQIANSFADLGYNITHGLLKASDFGVPQHRSRFFLIGSVHESNIALPKPRSGSAVTVSEAIGDLPSLENGAAIDWLAYASDPRSSYAKQMRGNLVGAGNHLVTRNAGHVIERFKHVPQGGNWEDVPESLMENYTDRTRCHTGIYHRLRLDSPSVVIGNYRKNMLIHPIEHRGLSVREAARLQSFPDWFTFKGSIGFQQQQVGNAVPPMLAQAVFTEIMQNIN